VIFTRWKPFQTLAGVLLSCLLVLPAFADSLPNTVTPLDAGKLVGKAIDDARQEDIVKSSKAITSGDWELSFGDGPEGGLTRLATSKAKNGGDDRSSMDFSYGYKELCDNEARRRVALSLELPAKRFPVKGNTGGQQTVGWVSFIAAGKPATAPKRQVFAMDELLGELHVDYNPGLLKAADTLVICPTAKPWDRGSKDCVQFGLKEFSRAFSYVCDAK
jgi:hypothetical protein